MGQTTYSTDQDPAIAGMLADADSCSITSYPASEAIAPGLFVELQADGTVKKPQSASLGKIAGVAIYTDMAPPGGYQIGDMVPVLRRGRVWMQFNGGAAADLAAVNVKHASNDSLSNAQYRGMATASATSATVGAEVDAVSSVVFRQAFSTTLAKVDVNLP